MVRVPAGKFLYGEEKREKELSEFWIDKTPVTNAEYARFVAATGHRTPQHWKGKTPPEDIAGHPVIYVSWLNAVAYAKWAGKRLPTEEEWEKAARGTDGREYPWGEWAEGRCNSAEAGVGGTTPVGQYSPDGDSPYGCVDMAGNVGEWTAPGEGSLRVLRGGSFSDDRVSVRCASRDRGFPSDDWLHDGFRVVVSPISPASASFGFAQDRL
jgi:formylglycine-generating enzyme required for sulfatase activity